MSNNTTGLLIFGGALLFMAFVFWTATNQHYSEKKLKKYVTERALTGNKWALKIKQKSIYVNWEEKNVIMRALNGDDFALEILGIEKEINK